MNRNVLQVLFRSGILMLTFGLGMILTQSNSHAQPPENPGKSGYYKEMMSGKKMGMKNQPPPVNQDDWICDKCHEIIASGPNRQAYTKCPHCGFELTNTQTGQRKNQTLLVASIIMMVLIPIFFYIRRNKPEN